MAREGQGYPCYKRDMMMMMMIYIYIYIDECVFSLCVIIQPRGCRCGVMVNAVDCGIIVSSNFSYHVAYVYFQTKTFEKGINPLFSQFWVK